MAHRSSPAVHPSASHPSVVVPAGASGWWTLGLLLLAGAAPLWWAPVETVFHNNWVQVGGALVLAAGALVAGAVEIFHRKDSSVAVVLAFALVCAEVLAVVGILAMLAVGLVTLE